MSLAVRAWLAVADLDGFLDSRFRGNDGGGTAERGFVGWDSSLISRGGLGWQRLDSRFRGNDGAEWNKGEGICRSRFALGFQSIELKTALSRVQLNPNRVDLALWRGV